MPFFSLRCVAELGMEFSKAVVVIVSTFLPLFHCVPRNDGNETQVRRKSSIYSNMSECEWNFEETALWNRQLHNQRYSSELNQKKIDFVICSINYVFMRGSPEC